MAPSIISRRKPQVPAEDTAAFGPIAERFRRAGDLDRAVSLCREGLEKFPDHISARVTLGWSLLDLGKYNEARTELEAVLRRAPDNLSAIRGLAELHDRSEHTMDLPMDGPGQWPPDAETLDQLDQATAQIDAGPTAAEDIVDEAVWVPVRGVNEPDEFDTVARRERAGPALIAPPEMGLAMWSAVPEVEPEIGLHHSPASGMSSMRDISDVREAATVPDPIKAFDAEIEALIAEANSLEAAADVASIEAAESTEPSLVLDAAVDLASFEGVDLAMPSELTVGLDAPVELTTGAGAAVGPFAEPDALVELTAGIDALVESVVEPPPEPVTVAAATRPELVANVAEEVASLQAEAEPITVAEQVGPAQAIAVVEPSVIAEPIALAPAPEDHEDHQDQHPDACAAASITEEAVHVAEVVTRVQVVVRAPPRSPVPGLERFLVQVQARRRLLVAESVA